MSIWGKVLGGVGGFAIGGPIGALVGAIAGHAVDKMRGDGAAKDGTKQIAFTIAVVVLGAKMAKADGQVTAEEIAAFREVFRVPPEEIKNVGRLFNQARRDAHGFEPYAKQVAQLFRDNPAVLSELLSALFHIAKADNKIHPDEIAYLAQVAAIFGFDEAAFERIRAEELGPDAGDPYTILGLNSDADMDTVKRAYRTLARENHPDKLIADGMPHEFVALANERMATINAAYGKIANPRGAA